MMEKRMEKRMEGEDDEMETEMETAWIESPWDGCSIELDSDDPFTDSFTTTIPPLPLRAPLGAIWLGLSRWPGEPGSSLLPEWAWAPDPDFSGRFPPYPDL